MITEIAVLYIRKDESAFFEETFGTAQKIISAVDGYLEHELQKCLEEENKYVLIVRWEKLEDHLEGFRRSAAYEEWKILLHHFYDPFPKVQHYQKIY